jgi:hypothetical protein
LPPDLAILADAARQHELRGELAEAQARWQEYLRYAPADYAARLGHGRVLYFQDRHAEADEALQTALQVNPDGAEALFFLSKARFEQGLCGAAQELFLRAASLDARLDHPGYRERLFGAPPQPTLPYVEASPVDSPPPATESPPPDPRTKVLLRPVREGLRAFHGHSGLKTSLRRQLLRPLRAGSRRSCLMFGPQDCGKRFLARCLAGELGAPLLELEAESCQTPLGQVQARERLYDFLRSGGPQVVTVLRLERLAGVHPHKPRPGLPGPLAFLEPVATSREPVLVCFHTGVPWIVPRSLRTSPWLATRFYVPPPDTRARLHLLDTAFGKLLTTRQRTALVQRTEGFTTADIGALILLMERHTGPARASQMLSRIVEEDRASVGEVHWAEAVREVARVEPSSPEWLAAARQARYSLVTD